MATDPDKPTPVRLFRAGDHVHVGPVGEDWELATDERDGKVVCTGWPEGVVDAKDCVLLVAATDEQRMDMLTKVSRACANQTRGRWAKEQLQAMAPEPSSIPCETCGYPTTMLETKRCNRCWAVEGHLPEYLKSANGRVFLIELLAKSPQAEEWQGIFRLAARP